MVLMLKTRMLKATKTMMMMMVVVVVVNIETKVKAIISGI